MNADHALMDSPHHGMLAAATLTQASYEDAIAFASAADDWSFDAMQLGPGHLRATSFRIALDPVLVSGFTCNLPILLQARPPRNRRSILLLGPMDGPCVVSGHAVTAEECVVMTSATAFEIVTAAAIDILTLAVDEAEWPACREPECAQVWTPGTQWRERLQATVAALRADLTSAAPAPVECSSRQQHVARILASLCELQASAARKSQQPVRYRALAVERARRYIHRHLSSPMRISAICAHTGVQARTLEYGFRELLGIPPVAYIKALRLNRVHRLLLSREAQCRTVTQIALDCGFWHLSQFAHDYQKLFGESPSVSRRRAHVRCGSPAPAHGSFNGRPSCTYAALCPPSA